MSTTGSEERGLIYLDDDEKAILKKVKSAVTDSGSEVRRGPGKEGITNLIDVLAVIRGVGPEAIEAEFEGQQYGAFKGAVAEAVVDYLRPVRERYEELRPDEAGAGGGVERRARSGPARSPPRRWPTCAARWASGRRSSLHAMAVAALDLDLEVFQGPFDLLLTLVLREEVDLLEVELADVVVAYIDHLEQRGELDLEAATEFLVLIAALLELKSRLMLPGEDEEGLDLEPGEAAEELLARMLEYRRYRTAAEFLQGAPGGRGGAPLPLGAAAAAPAAGVGRAGRARLRARAAGRGRRRPAALPPKLDLGHVARAARDRGAAAGARARRCCARLGTLHLRRRREGRRPPHRGRDPVRPARALQGRRGRLGPERGLRPDHDQRRTGLNDLARIIEALLFLSSEPVSLERLADACESSEGEVLEALARLREHYAEGFRGVVLREVAGGFTLATDPGGRARGAAAAGQAAHPAAHPGAGRVPGHRRLPPAGVAARDRAHPRRGLGVGRRARCSSAG